MINRGVCVRRGALAHGLLLASMSLWAVCAGTPHVAVHVADLSRLEIESLKSIAHSRPCAATAFLYIRGVGIAGELGTLYFAGIPSAESVAALLDEAAGSAFGTFVGGLQRSPYSTSAWSLEIRWSLARIDATSAILTTQAKLVDARGAALEPSRLIEPETQILISANTLDLLHAPSLP